MPKRKSAASAPTEVERTVVPVPTQTTPENPSTLRYLILVFSSFALSVAARTFSSYFVEGDLASVTRTIDDWPQISGFLGGRAVELALGWWGRYDGRAMMRNDMRDMKLMFFHRCGYGSADIVVAHALLSSSQDLLRRPPNDHTQQFVHRHAVGLHTIIFPPPKLRHPRRESSSISGIEPIRHQ